jgi:ribosomal protein S12 methylthiotransferase
MKIHFVSLGCDKNLVDSEVMLALLKENGYSFTDNEEAADIIILNTCCFIHEAKSESIETILRLAENKKSGACQRLVVVGCLAERYREEVRKELPEVDAIVGVGEIERIVEAVGACPSPRFPPKRRILTTGGYYAYLKIAEGCDKHCTYCIIPAIRGAYASVPMEELLTESVNLVANGVRELILVAQETTLYGRDLYGQKMLPELLQKLAAIEDLRWIRLLYCYPEEISDELIATIKNNEKICPYLDIPIQHGSDRVLQRMGRRTNRQKIGALIKKLRAEIPDICLRTTLLTGFPGESKADHQENLRLIEELRFDRLGVFAYSAEEGTPAARMAGQISERTKKRLYQELMAKHQSVAFASATAMVGKRLTVLVEGEAGSMDISDLEAGFALSADDSERLYVTRTYRDAPDIDSYLFLKSPRQLNSGDFVEVEVTGACGYDLIGRE